MDRREFCQGTVAAAAMLAPAWPLPPLPPQESMRVNGTRLNTHLRELSQFGRTPEGGINRLAYSEANLAGREYVIGLMRMAQLETTVDAAGNIVGRRVGGDSSLPPLMMGSHIDSVPEGGNYDGQVGSMGAMEVARTLAEQNHTMHHPLEVVIFQNEEGGKTGSRAISGEVASRELALVTRSGHTIGDGIGIIGGNLSRFAEVQRQPGSIAAYLELHIEQGAFLEREGIAIGIVEGIVGIKRWTVVVEGFANHAGTTPMGDRRDAMLGAARLVDAVNRIATSIPGRQVATVGRLEVEPGAPNVIPGRVTLTLEIRDLDMAKIDTVYDQIHAEAHRIGGVGGTSFTFDEFYVSHAAPTDERIRDLVAAAADELGLSARRMPSGAGHDAQSIAQLAPVGMIFIPSVGGISHSPNEFSQPDDITNGANVLLHTLLKLDAVALD